jgi:hypothetical protein
MGFSLDWSFPCFYYKMSIIWFNYRSQFQSPSSLDRAPLLITSFWWPFLTENLEQQNSKIRMNFDRYSTYREKRSGIINGGQGWIIDFGFSTRVSQEVLNQIHLGEKSRRKNGAQMTPLMFRLELNNFRKKINHFFLGEIASRVTIFKFLCN